MRNKNLLLIIDMQNDFATPGGSMYIDGAEKDTDNLQAFIMKNEGSIDQIILTQDAHHVIDVSHPGFWEDEKGNHPEPFTAISAKEVRAGKWKPLYFKEKAVQYIHALEAKGEFPHVIWPEHCIDGSKGGAITDKVMEAVSYWARKGRFFEVIRKGLNPLTEHFGALRANIPDLEDKASQLNEGLTQSILQHENVYIAGQAKSHCVANTVKQIIEIEGLKSNLFLLEDAMSNVKGFEELATPIYKNALERGALFVKTTETEL